MNSQNPSPIDLSPMPSLSDDIRRYFGLAWHWAWILVLTTLIGGVVGYVYSSRITPVYSASATMWLSESRNLNEYANILVSERLAETYARLMVQQPVLEGVVNELDLNITAESLRGKVTVILIEETQLLQVAVEDTDPVRAAQIANAIGLVFSQINQEYQSDRYSDSKSSLALQLEQVDQQIKDASEQLAELRAGFEEVVLEDGTIEVKLSLEQQRERDRLETNLTLYQQIYANLLQSFEAVRLAEIQSSSIVSLVDQANPPVRPIRPNVFQDTLLATLIGLIVGAGIIFLIEMLDDTVKGPSDISRQLNLPILGLVARLTAEQSATPITAAEPRSPISEGFRVLRTNIQYASVDKPINKILVTSPMPQDGKSTDATNLAVVIAQSGRSVTIIDADMRRPSLHRRLRMANRVGLSDLFVQDKINLDGTVRETRVAGMSLMTSGGLPPNPSELIGSAKMMDILGKVKDQSDIVIVDTPPVMAVTDAASLAPKLDGVIIVVRPGKTKLAQTKQTVDQLRRGGANILGVVLNDIEYSRSRYYFYYRGYYASEYAYYGNPEDDPRNRNRLRRKRETQPLTE